MSKNFQLMSLNEAREKYYDLDDLKNKAADRLRQRLSKIHNDFKQSTERKVTDPILEALSKPVDEEVCIGTDSKASCEFQVIRNTTEATDIATIDEEAGVPDSSNFHIWLTDKFGFNNVPQFSSGENPIYDKTEDWPEWPESDTWPSAIDGEVDEIPEENPEPDPMDMKGNNIAKRLAGLQAELKKIEENKNVLVVEKENLSNQLKACKKRIADLVQEQTNTLQAIEIAKEEQMKHIAEMDALHMYNERKKREDDVINEIRRVMDDFSQAVQILLNSGKYCDLDQLIRVHIKNSVYLTDEVKRSIITEARYLKRDRLYASLEVDNCYLAPKNEDGLPNLFDQYITDSYDIIYE